MIQTPCEMVVDANWDVHHGKRVSVNAPCIVNGLLHYDCHYVDGSGNALIPEDLLKPIEE